MMKCFETAFWPPWATFLQLANQDQPHIKWLSSPCNGITWSTNSSAFETAQSATTTSFCSSSALRHDAAVRGGLPSIEDAHSTMKEACGTVEMLIQALSGLLQGAFETAKIEPSTGCQKLFSPAS